MVGLPVALATAGRLRAASGPGGLLPGGGTIQDFEQALARARRQHYTRPAVDILGKGFRPVGGSVGDFATVRHEGRDHFFYIERRLQEGTPFFPGHEIYFGHASTANFFDWEVHEPVLLVRPGTWEEAHVWAPCILPHGGQFLMAYTGLNRHLSQNLGLAWSRDLFTWRRWPRNPLSPCKGAAWAAWREDDICSCRDPHLLRHEGRVWMIYTASTRTGATCVAMTSTADLRNWKDHGPILVGPPSGYEPNLWGGHVQGSYESANLSFRAGRWLLLFHAALRGRGHATRGVWSERRDAFKLEDIWDFWTTGGCVEVVRDQGEYSLLAGVVGGTIRFAEVHWAEPQPVARPLTKRAELERWQSA
jgi:hypothetical protein